MTHLITNILHRELTRDLIKPIFQIYCCLKLDDLYSLITKKYKFHSRELIILSVIDIINKQYNGSYDKYHRLIAPSTGDSVSYTMCSMCNRGLFYKSISKLIEYKYKNVWSGECCLSTMYVHYRCFDTYFYHNMVNFRIISDIEN
jgi:hypothetical protein